MAKHNELGRRGEETAAVYLERKSYRILEKNWRSGRLEIDIIARTDNELVITEVKTRSENCLESPLHAVNRKKQKMLIRAANAYMGRSRLNLDVRFDIVIVIFNACSGFSVEHIENAFFPSVRS